MSDPQVPQANKFMAYFSELRKNLIHVVIFFTIVFICLAPFSKDIYVLLSEPLQNKLPENAHMIATDITATFVAPIKLVFFVTLILLIPFIFYKIYSYLKSALYIDEKKVFFIFLPASVVLFYVGIAIGYFFILPTVLGFFIQISPSTVIPMTDINQYLLFCIKFFLVLGSIFQLPLLIIVLIYFGIVDVQTLKQKRVFVFIFCFFIAMFITPPDILSMAVAGCFMYFLFEIGLFFADVFFNRKV